MNYVRPSLTEPGVTYFLQETLIDEIADFCVSLPSVKAVRVKTAKTQAYENCKAVGIEVFKWK